LILFRACEWVIKPFLYINAILVDASLLIKNLPTRILFCIVPLDKDDLADIILTKLGTRPWIFTPSSKFMIIDLSCKETPFLKVTDSVT